MTRTRDGLLLVLGDQKRVINHSPSRRGGEHRLNNPWSWLRLQACNPSPGI